MVNYFFMHVPWIHVLSTEKINIGVLDSSDKIVLIFLNQHMLFRLHRCWWRKLETKCVGDNLRLLVTVLAILTTNILYVLTLASGTNILGCHQDLKSVANNPKLSPTVSHQHHNITNMTVASPSWQRYILTFSNKTFLICVTISLQLSLFPISTAATLSFIQLPTYFYSQPQFKWRHYPIMIRGQHFALRGLSIGEIQKRML